MEREATCSCGALRVRCVAEPELVSMCHCRACQRRTGSVFGLAAFFQKKHVQVEGGYRTYSRVSDAGFGLDFHFCGTCGSTVFWEPSRMPQWFAIAVGAFADPDFPRPSQEVYVDCRHGWVQPLQRPSE